jgi:hypothetical protein
MAAKITGILDVTEENAMDQSASLSKMISMSEDQLGDLVSRLVEAKLAQRAAQAISPEATDVPAMIQELVKGIGRMATQGTGQPEPIPPHVLKRREDARQKMIDLIIETEDRCMAEPENLSLVPRYQVLHEMCLNGQQFFPFEISLDPNKPPVPTEILYRNIPNISMYPRNEIAKKIHEQFMIWAGDKPIHGHNPNESYSIAQGREGNTIAMRLREQVMVIRSADADGLKPGAFGMQTATPAQLIADRDRVLEYQRRNGLDIQPDQLGDSSMVLGTFKNPATYGGPDRGRSRFRDNSVPRHELGQGRMDIEAMRG